ncbi:MAG: hypothetical protein ACRCZA_12620 [Shewanella sp.]|uniref:LPD3 domain-containing protein n=1 Tax=Shewanella sp. TaxID=50422 RepID=UPI003F3D98B3
MAETYEQDGKGLAATAYLHYFRGGADWYITEKDSDGGTRQAYGWSDLGAGGELGYISIDELTAQNIELDLHFEPKALSSIVQEAPQEETKEKPDSDGSEVQVIELTGKELGEFADTPEGKKELRRAAKARLEAMIGDSTYCSALKADVEIRRAGVKKVISLSSDPQKLMMVGAIKDIIRSASLLSSRPPYDGELDKSARAYHILRAKVLLDHEKLAARVVVKEDVNGAFHYDISVHKPAAVFDCVKEKGHANAQPFNVTTTNGGGTYPSCIARHQLNLSIGENERHLQKEFLLNSEKTGEPACAGSSILMGGNRGCTCNRSAAFEPCRLLPSEPSSGHQDDASIVLDAAAVNMTNPSADLIFNDTSSAKKNGSEEPFATTNYKPAALADAELVASGQPYVPPQALSMLDDRQHF